MGLQRSLSDKFRRVLLEGRGRYLELEGRTKDMRGRGLRIVSRGAPHSRECSYMNLLANGEQARGRGGGVQNGRCAAKRIYVLPLGTRQWLVRNRCTYPGPQVDIAKPIARLSP
jgi:hypothetical protein